MDSNNWRPPNQGTEPTVPAGDWRADLQSDSRERIVNKIMETLKKHLPASGADGLQELRSIAQKFEEKIFNVATNQSDYLRKISLKMLTMENRSQNTMAANQVGQSSRPPDQGLTLQPQVHNPGQQNSIPLPSQTQQHQQLLSQNFQNNVAPQANLPPMSSLAQTSSQNIGQNNVQNIPVQNSVGSNIGLNSNIQNMYSGSQRQFAGRQQGVPQQQQQQQNSQNPQQYLYQQHQLLKHKVQLQSQTQPQQQQNLVQSNQLQSSQQSVMQPSMMQTSLSSLPQNQQSNNVQQSTQSMLQQQVFRHQQQQTSSVHQQQASMTQQPILSVHQQQQQQQQQQLMGPQSNATNLQQHARMYGPQSNVGDIQQPQRLLSQQSTVTNLQQRQQQKQLINQRSSLTNMHQQQLGNNVPGLRQQQLLGTESGSPGMQTSHHSVHTVQQPMQQQNSLPSHGQQSQPQASAQKLMPQIHNQPVQLQQQMGLQPQPNQLQDIQQRLQASGSLLQQNAADQNKQLYEHQRALPESSTTQTAQPSGADWQEEVYQKVQTMKEKYLTEMKEMYQKVVLRLQQHESLPQQAKPDQTQIEKMRTCKMMLERFMTFLQISKSNILSNMKDKLDTYEKQIINLLNLNRPRKGVSLLQPGQLPPTHMPSMPQSQVTEAQPHDNQINSQLQTSNTQGSVTTTQQNNISSLQHNSMSGASTAQQNLMNLMRSGTNLDSGQGNSVNSLQQVSMSSLQQNPVSTPQQTNINSLPSQGGVNVIQPNLNTQSGSSMLQYQLKHQQEQQLMQNPQFKQPYQQQQMMQRQQVLQRQQQLHQPAKQQMPAQLQSHQLPQLQKMNDINDMKTQQGMGFKQGVFQQHLTSGQQHSAYSHQKLKQGSPFSVSSPQHLQAASPQISQHSSPQVEQQNNLPSQTKVATPLQSSNSPFMVPTPSPPMAPSPMLLDSEKSIPGVSSIPNVANVGYQQTGGAAAQAHSLAIGTPGISASPLLAEFSGPDGAQVNALAATPERSTTEQPLERLIRAVKSMSTETLAAAVNDIGSVVSMNDRIAVSAPGNGSKAAVGEDLAFVTNCRVQAGIFFTQDDNNENKRMKRYTEAVPLDVVSSSCSMSDCVEPLNASEASDQEPIATSSSKTPKVENHALIEEIKKINNRLIDTVVDISDEDADQTAAAAAECPQGTLVKCSFTPVALSPTLKFQYTSGQMSTIEPLRLLVPPNYPNCSPILLDKFSFESSGDSGDLSEKAKLRFRISLRSLSEPMSLGDIAKAWDACARGAISEYAQQRGGGTFSSKYGSWDAVTC